MTENKFLMISQLSSQTNSPDHNNSNPEDSSQLSIQSPAIENFYDDDYEKFIRLAPGTTGTSVISSQQQLINETFGKGTSDTSGQALFGPIESDIQKENTQKISSVMIVFNTWNAMIGCGTVTLPWAFQQSGILLGVFITAIACLFAFITNYMLLRVAGKDTNFSETMHRFFPSYGWPFSMACFIVNFYVGIILFYQVLSQSLYPILLFASGSEQEIDLKTDWSQFSLSYTCLILLVILLVMTAPRDTGYIMKVNAFGVVFLVIFLMYIIGNSLKSIATTEYVYSKQAFADDLVLINSQAPSSYTATIPLFGASFMPLMGILGGGFYFHNMSLMMLSNAKEPQHNTRNISIGFILVFLTYCTIGVTGVYGFTGSQYAQQYSIGVDLMKENCLNMIASDDVLGTFIRACILCQMLCVNVLIFGLLRKQILLFYAGVTQGNDDFASADQTDEMIKLSRFKNLVLSFLLYMPALALAIWFPYVGKLGALIAAFSTMFVIYLLPLATYCQAVWMEQKDDNLNFPLSHIEQAEFELAEPAQSIKMQFERYNISSALSLTEEALLEKKPCPMVKDELCQEKKLTKISFFRVALGSIALALYGITVFVIQILYLAASAQLTV